MKLLLTSLIMFCVSGVSMQAQEYTFNEDIAPILFDNCTSCHRAGEIGPFPMTTYDEVKPWSAMIDYVTSIKYMPPWSPEPSYSEFQGERVLTDEELLAIKTWVADGSPEGSGDAPDLPSFPSGSQIGTPDLVLDFAESFHHQGNNEDDYQVFVLPTGLTEDRVVKAIEVRPGNTKIVHHALISYDAEGIAQELDAETPEYGYPSFGGFGDGLILAFTRQFAGYVPGQKPSVYPVGVGQNLPANSDLLVQMHYAPIASPQSDSSTVNIFFAKEDEPIDRLAQNILMTPFTATGDPGRQLLNIPANTVQRYHYSFTIVNKISVFSVTPHMHLLGKDWEVYALSPQGDTTKLVQIQDWDFNWQGSFDFTRFQILEAGSTIHAYATYDNTENNPLNPNNPPARVTWGERTTDEMFYLPITFVNYQDGDEDVILDGQITAINELNPIQKDNHLYPISPNPVADQIKVKWKMKKGQKVRAQILTIDGKLWTTCFERSYNDSDMHEYIHDGRSLVVGSYILRLTGEYFDESQIFQKFE